MAQITTHDLWSEGRNIKLTAGGVSSLGVMVLSWTLPTNPIAFNGAIVLVSEQPIFSDNLPIDGTRYLASTNWAAPADSIGEAQVVSAFYGFFGDSILTSTVTVTGLDPSKVYYASIHAASNVLQYYTVGSMSYPLESNGATKKNSAYAGSIPQSSTPPQNPTDGQVYYDPGSNTVLLWNAEQLAWIKANDYPVRVSTAPPVDVAQLFFRRAGDPLADLRFFDGTAWVTADATNLQVKLGATWVPFSGSVTETGVMPPTPVSGDFILLVEKGQVSAPSAQTLKFFSLGRWYNITPDMVQVLIGATWTPIATPNSYNSYGDADPVVPQIGDFFYNSASKDLMVWIGNGWSKADTVQAGEPTYDKTNVGTDGSADARLQLIRAVKTRMGYPSVCVELIESNFMQAVDSALATLRQMADNAYEHRHISFTLLGHRPNSTPGGQNKYYLNDPRDGTNRIVNIVKVHRINQLGISSLSAENGLYAQAFFNQVFQGPDVDVLSIHLMHQLSEVYEKIFAGNIVFTWDESSREFTVLRRINQERERVVLEAVIERTEQDLIGDRWVRMWIQDWAYADALEQLGWIRTKFGTLPSAQGGLTLNGDALLNKAAELKLDLRRQIADYEIGNGGIEFGSTAFMIG